MRLFTVCLFFSSFFVIDDDALWCVCVFRSTVGAFVGSVTETARSPFHSATLESRKLLIP